MRVTLILIITLIILPLTFNAKEKQFFPKCIQLKVGDKVPDYTLKNLINYTSDKANLSEFKGKLLILDFWITGCASCIAGFSKMNALQKEFGNKIQIILTNPWQKEDRIRQLLAVRKKLTKLDINIPIVCGDTALLKLFPVTSVPHIVWISPDGIVSSITAADAVNSKNINSLLSDEPIQLWQKTDVEVKWDSRAPLFINGNGGEIKNFLSQSILSKYLEGFGYHWDVVTDDERSVYQIRAINSSIRDMYRLAYSNYFNKESISEKNKDGSLERIPLNRVLLNVADTTKYVEKINGESIKDNLYAYQFASSKPLSKSKLQEIMKLDLKKYFGLTVQWKIVKRKCLVFASEDTLLVSNIDGRSSFSRIIDDVNFKVSNYSIDEIINWMELATNYYFSPYPILNETGMRGKIGLIEIQTNVYDHTALNRALQKYKMAFKLEEREIPMLVISDK